MYTQSVQFELSYTTVQVFKVDYELKLYKLFSKFIFEKFFQFFSKNPYGFLLHSLKFFTNFKNFVKFRRKFS